MEWIDVKDRLPEFYIGEKHNDVLNEKTKQCYFTGGLLVYAQHADLGCCGVYYADYNKDYNWREKKWNEPYFR